MRLNRTAQPSVFQPHEVVHLFAEPLERASEWLDEHPELLDMVGACVAGSLSCGRRRRNRFLRKSRDFARTFPGRDTSSCP